MKLSAERRFGFIHAKGGKLLRVAHAHQVSLAGFDNRNDHERDPDTGEVKKLPRRFDPGQTWCTADVGDLALEVLNHQKDDRLLGHVYLSGKAVGIIRYSPAPDHWFGPAELRRFDLRTITEPDEAAGAILAMKHADVDLVAASLKLNGDPYAAVQWIANILAYEQAPDAPPLPKRADVVFVIRGHRRKGALHYQAPGREQPFSATPFAMELCCTADAPMFELPFRVGAA